MLSLDPRGGSSGGEGMGFGEGGVEAVTVTRAFPLAHPGLRRQAAKSFDVISTASEMGRIRPARRLHHPAAQMKYNGENGRRVMEIDLKET